MFKRQFDNVTTKFNNSMFPSSASDLPSCGLLTKFMLLKMKPLLWNRTLSN